MIKKLLCIISLFSVIQLTAQTSFKKHWGALYPTRTHIWRNEWLLPIYQVDTSRFRSTRILPIVNKSTNNLYILEEPVTVDKEVKVKPPIKTNSIIYEFNENNNTIKEKKIDLFNISHFLFNNTNEMIIQGANTKVYGLYKLDNNDKLTLILPNAGLADKSSITIDKDNNIYILSKASKNTTLSPSFYQSTGDQNTIINNQDIISKFDSKGNHIWSTFYFNNQSHIWGIAAGTNGLYVYGHEFLTTANSNYFGTANGHQPKASGIISNGDPNSAKNAFLTKFSFNGTRIWSTYIGPQLSMVPMQTNIRNNKSMEVVGDDVYIITDHVLPQGINNVLNTKDAAIKTTTDITNAKTLSKFSGDGKLQWSSYLYDAETLYENTDKTIMISSSNKFLTNLPNATNDAYQANIKGTEDNITYNITPDGKTISYLSYFGDIYRENGIAIPSKNGYYVVGGTVDYPSKNSPIITANSYFKKLELLDTYTPPFKYVGNFVAFFTKTLSTKNHEITDNLANSIKVYPNPTTDLLTIDGDIMLSYNSSIIIYDLNGKKIIEQNVTDQYKNTINIGHLPTSVYILEIADESERYQVKIIKK